MHAYIPPSSASATLRGITVQGFGVQAMTELVMLVQAHSRGHRHKQKHVLRSSMTGNERRAVIGCNFVGSHSHVAFPADVGASASGN